MVPVELLADDRERQFADWGVAVMWREVSSVFDPETQAVSETHVDVALMAIVGAAVSKSTAGTAGQHLSEERQFLVKVEELPESGPAGTSRIVFEGVEYDVLEFALAADGLVSVVRCRRRG